MSIVGQIERKTQDRVVKLFREQLDYEYLGDWHDGNRTSGIEVDLLEQNLRARGYDDVLISRALDRLQKAAAVGTGHGLYEANREVYELLRYGVKVKAGVGDQTQTVWLVDWQTPTANHFALAEEVTVLGQHTKRPDIVLYVNGLALGVIELKRSKVSVTEGIRQNIGNQSKDFIRPFFSTVQFLFAGNDAEGLRYGVIDTPEKYWLEWKEESAVASPLDRALLQMCSKDRFLELIHDFIVFDSGVKKGPRHNQYFGIKAAQERIARREGGIIWHTQGSGKSLTMVWLAKWIRENQPDARVLLITDRTELDEQIEKVFNGVSESIYRAKSGADLIATLNASEEWLIGSLVHKFRGANSSDDDDTEDFIAQLTAALPKDFKAKGNIFVFVDEAHRTQSGRMHRAMKQILPDAMFIGFTGTPLLKADKATSIETFGSFIHTYKFNEAVDDGVVLDLRYEARDIDQELTSPAHVDKWFEVKTKGMTDLSRAELKKRWGTMQKVVSSRSRAERIVQDILLDMATKPRLMDGRGNAMLVGSSIYQACKFYEMFVNAGFKGKCAIVTSYQPNASEISKEDSGAGKTEKLAQYDIYRRMLADYFETSEDEAVGRVEEFEAAVKKQFIKEPGQMRLLVVVDKLLTGFDAPSATYLYIDKKMQDHGLFQAICRVNRLDGDDKDYGYIIDYRDLFNSLETAINDYTTGALDGYEKQDIEGLLSDRIDKARENLDDALERIRALCEPVLSPKGTDQYRAYFVSKIDGDDAQIKANEPKRVELYKAVAAVTRAYANLANDMTEAGYSSTEIEKIKQEIAHYSDVRTEVKLAAGEDVDFKAYEADMRFLLDTYISAGASQVVSDFEDAGLIDLIVNLGAGAIDKLPDNIKKNQNAVAATIVNNMRKVIVDEHALNPKFYDRMSELLDALLEERRKQAIAYEEYLAKILEVAQQLGNKESGKSYTSWVKNEAQRALVDTLDDDSDLAFSVDSAIRSSKQHGWKDNRLKSKKVRLAIGRALPDGDERIDQVYDLVRGHDEYN
ncbi:restriction endonuclease subunit R [Microbacterium sorbitolivorans]|uniref:Type I restriction enzyme endonuclease subunit n=1 Tax=Microbacterium sorbitolivorans TaxID=1867410 RepID=A0A367Y6R5_9MICO|nr:HsdR family type I site-specific deoxyribonuclease [Microbacterium sorbitolivorans]RCK61554.1 HsdR family type I site-specific deoxyribonuclease [Microbacterium sorbitolivorans]GGF31157.1 restriction endonuclease subunit R [Microbacterium sorbitolivorans]